MDYICDICGKTYEPVMKHISDELWDIPFPNRLRVEIAYTGSLSIHTFETCRQCAGELLAHINYVKRKHDEKRKENKV